MNIYKNKNGNSNVSHYEIGLNFIRVKFNGIRKLYTYGYGKAGITNVEKMKDLAISGRGLNGYINQNVNDLYD